jgi:transcriptional regulator with XRE-family HTH domain
MTEFKDRFEEARKAKNLSRRELGRLSGVHPNTLNRWASGETQNPQPDELRKVTEVLDVPYEHLRTGKATDTAAERQAFYSLEVLSEGAGVLVIGQALQAMLKALPPRGISLDDPRLAQVFQSLIRRSRELGEAPKEEWVLEELMKPIS